MSNRSSGGGGRDGQNRSRPERHSRQHRARDNRRQHSDDESTPLQRHSDPRAQDASPRYNHETHRRGSTAYATDGSRSSESQQDAHWDPQHGPRHASHRTTASSPDDSGGDVIPVSPLDNPYAGVGSWTGNQYHGSHPNGMPGDNGLFLPAEYVRADPRSRVPGLDADLGDYPLTAPTGRLEGRYLGDQNPPSPRHWPTRPRPPESHDPSRNSEYRSTRDRVGDDDRRQQRLYREHSSRHIEPRLGQNSDRQQRPRPRNPEYHETHDRREQTDQLQRRRDRASDESEYGTQSRRERRRHY